MYHTPPLSFRPFVPVFALAFSSSRISPCLRVSLSSSRHVRSHYCVRERKETGAKLLRVAAFLSDRHEVLLRYAFAELRRGIATRQDEREALVHSALMRLKHDYTEPHARAQTPPCALNA